MQIDIVNINVITLNIEYIDHYLCNAKENLLAQWYSVI